MAVLLTGVAGFIGSTTAEFLIADGRRGVGVDRVERDDEPRQKRTSIAGLVERRLARNRRRGSGMRTR